MLMTWGCEDPGHQQFRLIHTGFLGSAGNWSMKAFIVVLDVYMYTYILINSLAPGRCRNSKSVMCVHMFGIEFLNTSCEITLGWMPQHTFAKSTTALVMAWCGHYLSQCWPRSLPQWVKMSIQHMNGLVADCGICNESAMEIPQSYARSLNNENNIPSNL